MRLWWHSALPHFSLTSWLAALPHCGIPRWATEKEKPRNPVPTLCYRSPSSQDPEASDSAKNPPCKILPHLEKLRSLRLSPTSSKRKVPSEGVLNFRHGTSEGFRGTPRGRQHREHSSFAQHTALAVSATPRSS